MNDFVKYSEVEESLLENYKNKLPLEVINIWKEYGLGTFYDGYLKVINPNEFKSCLEDSYFLGNVSIPIFATAFGDLITWEKNQFIGIVKYRYGESDVIADGFDFFFEDLREGEFDEEYLSVRQYREAVDRYGSLNYDECFGYVPLLALGGRESVDHLKKVKIKEHIALINELVGEI